MPAKGYTTRALVSDELGTIFDAVQELQADTLIEAAEAAIDRLAADAWLVPSPATEIYWPAGDLLDLMNAPVTTITSVTARSSVPGDTAETLVAGSDYELVDAARGVLSIPGRTGQMITVVYTFTTPCPADIARATTILAAEWMRPRVSGGGGLGVSQVTVGDVSVRYESAASLASSGIPTRVLDLVAQARRPIFT